MDRPRTPSLGPGKVSPTFDVTRHQVPDKRADSSSKRPREMVDTGTINEPTLKKPKRELTKVNIQLISDISEEDVSKTAKKRITNCERAILNTETSAEEKAKYRKAIPLIKEAQEFILANLKNEDRENSIKALAASDDHIIQHILKEIAKGKQQAPTSDKRKEPARPDAPPSQTSEDVNTADTSPFVETLKHRKSAIERIRTLASTASAQDLPDYDVGKAQRNGDLRNACNEFLLSEELTENPNLKRNYPDVYGAHDEQYVTNLINFMYEVEEKEAPEIKGRGSNKLEIISEILELYEKRNLPQV